MGYAGGLPDINYQKNYVSSNMMVAEKYMRGGRYNVGFFGCSYPLYYLKQEPDFLQWYKFEYAACKDYSNAGYEGTKFVLNEMKIW